MHNIELMSDVSLVISPLHRILFVLKEKLTAKLKRMEKLDIEKIEKPTDWLGELRVKEKKIVFILNWGRNT